VKPDHGRRPGGLDKKALKHAGIGADKIDRVEFNEAFAAQYCIAARARHPRREGQRQRRSIAIGHPSARPARGSC